MGTHLESWQLVVNDIVGLGGGCAVGRHGVGATERGYTVDWMAFVHVVDDTEHLHLGLHVQAVS